MNKMSIVLAFVLGAAAGSAATVFIVKKKYERLAQEEIDSVKESFAEYYGTGKKKTDEDKSEPDKEATVAEYAAKLKECGYTNYSTGVVDPEEEEDDEEDETETLDESSYAPYVIPQEEFGEDEEYTQISFSYYADKVLADEDDRIVHDVEGSVGFDSLNHFGEYDDDAVYVKNNRLKCYYEILIDERKYSDVLKKYPYKAEV